MKWSVVARLGALAAVAIAGGALSRQEPAQRAVPIEIAELWQEPVDLLQRDLEAGPGGAALAPDVTRPFQFVSRKTSGTSPGYDVRDASGRRWSVKLGEEAQAEVTASRILWAMGFHQPSIYYVPKWTLAGEDAGVKSGARFRTNGEEWKPGAEWSWYENPFVESQSFRGLIVAQMLLNNWDLKTSNNRIYHTADAARFPRRLFLVRDLGSALGSAKQHPFFAMLNTRGHQGSKNDLEGFERQGFIKKVDGNRVEFDYRGLNDALLEIVTPPDVVWACELLSRLPDGHWVAAFRAGGYGPDETGRYIKKIKEKMDQGLALRAERPATPARS